jgi:hypothetical protein
MPGVIDAALWSVAAMLGSAALWMSRPRPPSYDPARIWGMTLSTLVRGRFEREGKEVADWEQAVARLVPSGIPGDWFADPATLGPDHDPGVRIGPAAGWEAIAEDAPDAWAAVQRSLESVRFVRIGDAPALEWPTVDLATPDEGALRAICATPELRLVLVLGAEPQPTLDRLAADPALRDRVRALFCFGGQLDDAWVATRLRHETFDTELARQTPWLWLQRRDGGQESTALTTPPEPPTARRSIDVVGLGVLDADAWSAALHGRALVLLVAALG